MISTLNRSPLPTELLRDVPRAGTGDLDPGLGEQRAGEQYEGNVEQGVNRVHPDVAERVRRRNVVREPTVKTLLCLIGMTIDHPEGS